MTLTSIASTALALPNVNGPNDMAIDKDTKFEDRTQSTISAPLRFIIPQTEKPVSEALRSLMAKKNFSLRQNSRWWRLTTCALLPNE